MTDQQGFSLIELIIVIVIISIISVAIANILAMHYQTFQTANSSAEIDNQAMVAMEMMVNDIHTIRSASDVSSISSNQMTFINNSGSSIQYQLSGSTLLRNSQTVMSGVQSFTLAYTDANGATTAVPSAVRYISMTVTLAQGNLTSTLTTWAATRGLV